MLRVQCLSSLVSSNSFLLLFSPTRCRYFFNLHKTYLFPLYIFNIKFSLIFRLMSILNRTRFVINFVWILHQLSETVSSFSVLVHLLVSCLICNCPNFKSNIKCSWFEKSGFVICFTPCPRLGVGISTYKHV